MQVPFVEGEIGPAFGWDFLVDDGGGADAAAWVSDLAAVLVAFEDARYQLAPLPGRGDLAGGGAWAVLPSVRVVGARFA
ncbi:hypothetical protein OS122_02575 [Mycolicibacterium mucogenicum]|uniref:hypothetical protein n=1 Tax=Mycolicibacterium mucogenicum TaxID=56689 RepID=UPI00226AB658|nr:hypothetical protein [Mycolicibacterium mucogenicum]MCX8559784.1 hypothetical protein [Mycolicibacterium mucogenicum]